MFLSRLDLQGFKSFAHGISLTFRPGITAIVGPNGSGKSNVAEAIRWALGEQSLKALRGKKSEDVIFAGSDKKARLGVAEVSLHLNNEDQRAPLPYSEVVLTRRVYRDGEGEYLLNHQATRLQDMQLLLAQANFGQRTYSVIGQGMIDSFLISSPQERKHLFDEAAGVRQFQLKKDQAVHKLAQAKENLAQGETLMVEIEPRLRSLTRQVRRLERREEVERQLHEQQRLYYGLQWQALHRQLEERQATHSSNDGRRGTIEHELSTIQDELEQIERERTGSEVFAELQKKYNRVLDQKNALLQEQSVVKGRLEVAVKEAGRGEVVYHQHRLQELKRALDRIQEELDVAEQMSQRIGTSVEREEKSKAALDQQFAALEQQLSQIEGHGTRQSLAAGKSALRRWQQKFRQWQKVLAAETVDLPALRQQANALAVELTTLLDQLDSAGSDETRSLVTLQRSALKLMAERQWAAERLAEARAERQRVHDHRQRLLDERERLGAEHEKLHQESSIQELAKTNPEEAYAAYAKQAKEIEQRIAALDETLTAAREEINNFNALETSKKDRLFTLQKAFRDSQQHLNHATTTVNGLRVQMAKLEQQIDDLKKEIRQAMSPEAVDLIAQAADQKLNGDVGRLAEEIGRLTHQLQLIGGIDQQVTDEYRSTNERWEFLSHQADDLRQAIASLEKAIDHLESTIKQRFDSAFKKINQEFHQYFRTLFSGGRAELALTQEVIQPEMEEGEEVSVPSEPPSGKNPGQKVITGIEIKATPPGKKLQSITMLSGGERALTSIALLCAIISNNPSPFVVLDEVDAALDEANSQRFAAILDHLAKKTQFLVITHNRATMEKSQILYGVTMGNDGVSQILSVKMEDAEAIIQKHGNR
ncbi:MAG: AAA family ATPase [Candidatus Kerfeldbacteria bacterium]|nr:AAA family ATPase [Candidatus Kerfeldbacteria bacterium]